MHAVIPGRITYGTSSPDPDWPRRVDTTTMGDKGRTFQYWSTGVVGDWIPAISITPCAYCGLKAPSDVYQCLGCGAPR